jgi:hypothetical protein
MLAYIEKSKNLFQMKKSDNSKNGAMHIAASAIGSLGRRIRDLFRPEEVEVYFERNGKSSKYTYHVLPHKH